MPNFSCSNLNNLAAQARATNRSSCIGDTIEKQITPALSVVGKRV
jgi:hypothetical protein